MTTPPRKNIKRDFTNVEKSPTIDQQLLLNIEMLKNVVLKENEKFAMHIKELMLEQVKKLIAEMAKLREKNAEYEKSIDTLNSAQDNFSTRLNDLEQEKLNNRIEISGINSTTMNSQKSAEEIASQVLSIYNVKNFKSAYKRQITVKSQRINLLIVTFDTYEDKMQALDNKRTADVGKKCTVYFNHSLTGFNRSLYMHARIVAKSLNLKTAISYGRIFIRKPEVKFGTRIRSVKDLDDIANNGTRIM